MFGKLHRAKSLSILCVLLCAVGANGQAEPGDPVLNCLPVDCGNWSGLYNLGPDLMAGGDIAEIGHANLIPAGPHAGKLLLWNWPKPDEPTYSPRSFLWDPADPAGVAVVSGAGVWHKVNDIYCSGHIWLPNGDLLVVGGRDFTSGTFGHPAGTVDVIVWRNATNEWQNLTTLFGIMLQRERWYPTPVPDGVGNFHVVGHFGENPVTPQAQLTRDVFAFDALTGLGTVLTPVRENHEDFAFDCDTIELLDLLTYPRMHLTTRNELMWADGRSDTTHTSWFLRLEGSPDCSEEAAEPYRWREGIDGEQTPAHLGGNTVQYVVLDPDDLLDGRKEVIYTAGGVRSGDDEIVCPDFVSRRVERMTEPSDQAVWDDSPPDLKRRRFNHNGIILPDGSFLVGGGNGLNSLEECVAWMRPEIFYPPEIFGLMASAEWAVLDKALHARLYHSVWGLLLDGRVWAMGGKEHEGSGNHHSIELYSPPYLFRSRRPVIATSMPATALFGGSLQLTVQVPGGYDIVRVALLRPSSVTHAFDCNQRYVELDHLPIPAIAGGQTTFTILWPPPPTDDSVIAPPGYYMLAVVDANGVPSPMKFVRLATTL